MKISKEAAAKLGEALGQIAYENGAAFTSRWAAKCVDCVGVEETDMYGAIVSELVESGEEIYEAMHHAMYTTAKRLADQRGYEK